MVSELVCGTDVRSEVMYWKFPLSSFLIIPFTSLPAVMFAFNVPFDFKRFAIYGTILAFCLGFNAMKLVKLDSFRTATYLLAGLFFYDIWWVFGTSVVSELQKRVVSVRLIYGLF